VKLFNVIPNSINSEEENDTTNLANEAKQKRKVKRKKMKLLINIIIFKYY